MININYKRKQMADSVPYLFDSVKEKAHINSHPSTFPLAGTLLFAMIFFLLLSQSTHLKESFNII